MVFFSTLLQIRNTYKPLVKQVNMASALATCQYCRRCFYFYQQGFMALLGEEEGESRLGMESGAEGPSTSSLAPLPPPPSDRVSARGSVRAASEDVTRANVDEDGEADQKLISTSTTPGTSTASANDYIDCREVVLFSRILRMIDASSNSLRQQLVNDESK